MKIKTNIYLIFLSALFLTIITSSYALDAAQVNLEGDKNKVTATTSEYIDPVGDANSSSTDIIGVDVYDYKFVVTFGANPPYEDVNGFAVYFLDIDINLDYTIDMSFIANYYDQADYISFVNNQIIWDLEANLTEIDGEIQFRVMSEISWPPDDYFPDTGMQVIADYAATEPEEYNVEIFGLTNNSDVSGIVQIQIEVENVALVENASLSILNASQILVYSNSYNLTEGNTTLNIDTTLYLNGTYTLVFELTDIFDELTEEVYVITIANINEGNASEPGKIDTDENTTGDKLLEETPGFGVLLAVLSLGVIFIGNKR